MYTLGIDIGSTATKAVVLKNGKDIYASAIISFGCRHLWNRSSA